MQNLQQILNQGLQALNSGNLSIAEKSFNQVLTISPQEPNALFLLGGVRQKQGDFLEADKLMCKALPLHPNKPDVLNSLGNLAVKLAQPKKAITYYKEAIKKRTVFATAYFNLGLLYKGQGQVKEAVEALSTASKQAPKNAQVWSALGSTLKECDQLDKAILAFDEALKLQPNYINALHNKGVTLRTLQRPEEAIHCYDKALLQAENIPELHFSKACASYDLGNTQNADLSLNRAIALKPDYVLAHETLNKMYWEHGEQDKFSQSFQKAIKQLPSSVGLRVAYAEQLKLAKRTDEAVMVLNKALQDLGSVPEVNHCLGMLLGQTGNAEQAVEYISNAVSKSPNNERYRIDAANFLIRREQYSQALAHLDVAQQINPLEQEMWALKGLCWRFTGDERDAWLNNYDLFVQAKRIDTPAGYDNLEHFMHQLRTVLIGMHQKVKTPLDQSVRNGTQTAGRLLFQNVKEINDYRTVLEKHIKSYLAGLPDDPTHPFLSRKTDLFRFSGSWSVRLNTEGFHVNHVHPEGWLSGPTYIEVPKSIHPDDPTKAGWVNFGATGMDLGEKREKTMLSVCPQEGLCALFPSYTWHGTNPFHDESYRMTAPCDVLPV
jgi:Tfp pilus assembly protein PilF